MINTANARCPDGCWRPGMKQDGLTTDNAQKTDYCQEDSTKAGLYCTACYGSLIVRLVRGVKQTASYAWAGGRFQAVVHWHCRLAAVAHNLAGQL